MCAFFQNELATARQHGGLIVLSATRALCLVGVVTALGVSAVASAETAPQSVSPIQPKTEFAWPQADPASCEPAHKRATRLLKDFEPLVDTNLRAAIEQFVAKRGPRVPAAWAWNDIALAMLLEGDADAASWSGMHAIALQWTGHFVTNSAVYLIYAGRQDDALSLLHCAYASGYRSPYLFEAFSTVFRLKGDQPKAKDYILLAQELAPDDPAIMVEASMATTSGPPPNASRGEHQADDLERGLVELKVYAQRVIATAQRLDEEFARIENDSRSKEPRPHRLFSKFSKEMIEHRVNDAVRHVQYTRMSREEIGQKFSKFAGFSMKPGSSDFEKGYAEVMRFYHNLAVQSLIETYLGVTDRLFRLYGGDQVSGDHRVAFELMF